MTTKFYPSNTIDQAIRIQAAWAQIDEELTFGNLNIGTLVMDINQVHQVEAQLAGLENQTTHLRNQRAALYQAAWDKVKRVRSGIKATFGDDSSQYEMVGGTRLSERKSPTRKTGTPA
jgi:hypothetical protein